MRIPQPLARFNRIVTNPVQRLWAGRLRPFAIVEHVGRTSGRPYRTPVMAWRTSDGFAIVLTYGPDRDWLKNLVAAHGGRLQFSGRHYDVVEPHVLHGDAGYALLRGPVARMARVAGMDVLHVRARG